MANVFNTFSFNKWADTKKEEEIDKESRKRRHQQIKRLKEKLRKERELRESGLAGGDGDIDLEALIEALQSGEMIHADQNPFENWHNGRYEAGTSGGQGGMGKDGEGGGNSINNGRNHNNYVNDPVWENGGAIDLPDDYILEEIRRYRSSVQRDNRVSSSSNEPRIRSGISRIHSADDRSLRFQYNRRLNGIISSSDHASHSLPSSRSSSAIRPSSTRKTSARPSRNGSETRISSAQRRQSPYRDSSSDRFNFNRYVTK